MCSLYAEFKKNHASLKIIKGPNNSNFYLLTSEIIINKIMLNYFLLYFREGNNTACKIAISPTYVTEYCQNLCS